MGASHFSKQDLYVSPNGNDNWSGQFPDGNKEGTDGPLRTLERVRDLLRARKRLGYMHEPVTVWLREGMYPVWKPLEFDSRDAAPVTYRSYPGEQAVWHGGVRIQGWKEERVNGKKVWVSELPEAVNRDRGFRQLFVNGERRSRTRLPKTGYYTMLDVPGLDKGRSIFEVLFQGSDKFQCEPGDFKNWRNLTDIEVVVNHLWIDERMPVQSFDETSGMVRSSRRSAMALMDSHENGFARYYIENVFEELTDPGEWYMDRIEEKLYYIPMPGELIGNTEIVVPVTTQFIRVVGQPEQNIFVEFLAFKDITFQYSDWVLTSGGGGGERLKMPEIDYASPIQSAFTVPGVLYFEGAKSCTVEDCTIRHIGHYGIELGDGCMGNHVAGNHIHDTGAGGVKLNGSEANGPLSRRTGRNQVTDNHIHAIGRVFNSAAAILSMHASGNTFSYNHIHDCYHNGISCGWVWGYAENVSHSNLIEYNHLHDIGKGVLSDMGAIYTLGVQPGTVIRGNLIHDVRKGGYGGSGIYTDEGSSYIVVENNLIYNVDSYAYFQHIGRENLIRNNIFAFAGEGLFALQASPILDGWNQFTLERNLLITDEKPFFFGSWYAWLNSRLFTSDLNLLWDMSDGPLIAHNLYWSMGENQMVTERLVLEEWRQLGYDQHSIVVDPLLDDNGEYPFSLQPDSLAMSLGFRPFHTSRVGPRSKEKRVSYGDESKEFMFA
ncbi:right-handed parallel beta-helix repeat-containing protein [Paenibacillus gansuensis]|uniref:Right-handed parallel beta-helix repeat-containing protein n=1 Tax=Paenibacillus gansuensis TaxID=306542 RepID=A0ABW5P8X1_9BACL